MATATGFQFGATNTGGGLFGAKTTGTTGTAATGFSGFGVNKTTTASAFSFGAPAASTAATTVFGGFGGLNKTTAASGFSFGAAASTATSGLFGATKTTSIGSGLSLFGTMTTAAATPFQLGGTAAGKSSLFSSTATSIATSGAALTKPLENPKEAIVPNELSSLVTDLEKYIKTQKDVKDEISKISSEAITKTLEEITTLKQAIALIANGLQRDSVAVENLKLEVGQELKNAEIANQMKDISSSLQHDFSAPMEYFQRLVYSFETRINCYRQEIEELEMFLSSSSPLHGFTPQDLSNVFKRLNGSFVGLASDLQQVHEAVKVIKGKYLQYRRVVHNDTSDPFIARKKIQDSKGKVDLMGPSPFPVVQGAGIIASAFKSDSKSRTIGITGQPTLTSAFSKLPGTGLTRSLSFGGSSKSTALGNMSLGNSSLFGKTQFGAANSLNLPGTSTSGQSAFTLQRPPSGKRGKLF